MPTERLDFEGHAGTPLSARLDLPDGPPHAHALFAHCFTCSKDLKATRRVSEAMVAKGFGVLRFDFTGLGGSDGDFGNTTFATNVEDLRRAAAHLRATGRRVSLLVGHSLGGAAVIAAAADLPEVRAVATIGAPADVAHVLHNFGCALETLERDGEAEVTLGGRAFRMRRGFVEDARRHRLTDAVRALRRPLMILHAPADATVGVEAARRLFEAARHPKSFVSLGDASHLLDDPRDAAFAGAVIAEWAARVADPVADAAAARRAS